MDLSNPKHRNFLSIKAIEFLEQTLTAIFVMGSATPLLMLKFKILIQLYLMLNRMSFLSLYIINHYNILQPTKFCVKKINIKNRTIDYEGHFLQSPVTLFLYPSTTSASVGAKALFSRIRFTICNAFPV